MKFYVSGLLLRPINPLACIPIFDIEFTNKIFTEMLFIPAADKLNLSVP